VSSTPTSRPCQFLTGNGAFALVDTPWTVVYIAVLFMMHAWLGWLAVTFTIVMLVIAIVGQRLTTRELEKAAEVQQESTN
jgi:ATP-binding cassette subfamily C exporter for protease/lipase